MAAFQFIVGIGENKSGHTMDPDLYTSNKMGIFPLDVRTGPGLLSSPCPIHYPTLPHYRPQKSQGHGLQPWRTTCESGISSRGGVPETDSHHRDVLLVSTLSRKNRVPSPFRWKGYPNTLPDRLDSGSELKFIAGN